MLPSPEYNNIQQPPEHSMLCTGGTKAGLCHLNPQSLLLDIKKTQKKSQQSAEPLITSKHPLGTSPKSQIPATAPKNCPVLGVFFLSFCFYDVHIILKHQHHGKLPLLGIAIGRLYQKIIFRCNLYTETIIHVF